MLSFGFQFTLNLGCRVFLSCYLRYNLQMGLWAVPYRDLYSHSMRLLKLPDLLDLIHQVSSVDVLHDEIQSILEDRDGDG